MESSGTQLQVINLGRQLVKELGLESGTDTLSKWMAHYIAEQIVISDTANGEDKSRAENRCFETILQLWAYHDSYPGESNPFDKFNSIFKALESLSPDNQYPYNRSLYWTQEEAPEEVDIQQENVGRWVNTALSVDSGAKVLIEFALQQAMLQAADVKTAEWLKYAAELPNSDAVIILRGFLDFDKDEAKSKTVEIKELNERLEKLRKLESYSIQLREAIEDKIEELSS